MMQIIRVPGWGLSYSGAHYYGRRHSLHVWSWLIFWGQMTMAEIEAWEDQRK